MRREDFFSYLRVAPVQRWDAAFTAANQQGANKLSSSLMDADKCFSSAWMSYLVPNPGQTIRKRSILHRHRAGSLPILLVLLGSGGWGVGGGLLSFRESASQRDHFYLLVCGRSFCSPTVKSLFQ